MVTKPLRAVNLMLDSGAFMTWRSGRVIDIDQYADFLEAAGDSVQYYVNLDVLPGKYKQGKPSADMIEETAEASWKNYLRMKKRGLNPMPVFHRGERFYWLEKMVGEGVDFIGLGGVSMGAGIGTRMAWLDQVFTYLCGDSGWPPVKLHGFGIAALKLMFRYPWFSVDSTTWRTPGLYGKVLVPRGEEAGVYDYQNAVQIIVNSTARKTEFGTPALLYNKMGKRMAEYVCNYFNSLGIDFLALRESDEGRRRMLVSYFVAAIKQHIPKPFIANTSEHFFSHPVVDSDRQYVPKKLRFYFGIGPLKEAWELFKELGVRERLTAYPAISSIPRDVLADFIATGCPPEGDKNGPDGVAGDDS